MSFTPLSTYIVSDVLTQRDERVPLPRMDGEYVPRNGREYLAENKIRFEGKATYQSLQ